MACDGSWFGSFFRWNGYSPLRKRQAQRKIVNYAVELWGFALYVSIEKKKGAKEQMIVISNVKFNDTLELYRRRWEIETMFACLKTRGVPPSVVEAEIAQPGSTGVRVILNEKGNVKSVIPRGSKK
ncbi:MAG: hypothetical protein K940chlam2_00634 [Chlamydiae bacterium]|nr:hypothetical protein [Chlamydiota bacterium]